MNEEWIDGYSLQSTFLLTAHPQRLDGQMPKFGTGSRWWLNQGRARRVLGCPGRWGVDGAATATTAATTPTSTFSSSASNARI